MSTPKKAVIFLVVFALTILGGHLAYSKLNAINFFVDHSLGKIVWNVFFILMFSAGFLGGLLYIVGSFHEWFKNKNGVFFVGLFYFFNGLLVALLSGILLYYFVIPCFLNSIK